MARFSNFPPAILLGLIVCLFACSSSDDKPLALSNAATMPATQPVNPNLITVFMISLEMPYGTTAGNETFWKLVDEDSVNPAIHDILEVNGVRVGHIPIAAWDRVRDVVDSETTHFTVTRFNYFGAGSAQVDMSPPLVEQLLCIFDAHGMTGRLFGQCQDRLAFSFRREPRNPDAIRATICPVVESLVTYNNYALSDEPPDESLTQPETIYNLSLTADIPPNEILIVAPSAQASDPNRIGARFLTYGGVAQKMERVLLLINQPLPLAKAKLAPATLPGT